VNHEAASELLGAYALDAVDRDEALAIDEHLTGCPRCRAELAGHREAAALLAFAGADAPDGLWGRIAASLQPPADPELARLYPLRRRPSSVSARLAAALAAVAAALIVVLGLQVNSQRHDINALKSRVGTSTDATLQHLVTAALLEPGSTKVHLSSADGRTAVDAVLTRDGTGYLLADRLPQLTADRTYQLWGVVGQDKVSLGVLGAHPMIAPFRAAAPLAALAVTDEQAGGVVTSNQQPVVSAPVRS
jgi:anti-sigma factor RsiW